MAQLFEQILDLSMPAIQAMQNFPQRLQRTERAFSSSSPSSNGDNVDFDLNHYDDEYDDFLDEFEDENYFAEGEGEGDEDRISLIDGRGAPMPGPGRRRKMKYSQEGNNNSNDNKNDRLGWLQFGQNKIRNRTSKATKRGRQQQQQQQQNQRKSSRQNKRTSTKHHHGKSQKWTPTRLMRYLSLTAISAFLTFWIMRRESKALHWQEFHHLLQPSLKKDQSQCYSERRHGQNMRCTCPDPTIPIPGTSKFWKSHHDQMVKRATLKSKEAIQKRKPLDIVFLGDAIIERWQGTKDAGVTILPGGDYQDAFEKRFSKAKGGLLEGLALGTSSDTGPNLLWHIRNGLITDLNPKLWFISLGSNELFEEKCTDRFVVASILNVLKEIADLKPDAHFIIHGILPRKDNPKSKHQFLQAKWKYAQAINTQVRKFCEHSPKLYYMQAGPLFLEEAAGEAGGGAGTRQRNVGADWQGRRKIDQKLLEDGIHPTKKGMEVWGDYIVKRVLQILQDISEQQTKGLKDVSRRHHRERQLEQFLLFPNRTVLGDIV